MAPTAQSGTSVSHTDQKEQTEKAAGQLDALLRGTGFSPLHPGGWIRVTGEDRARWLNGMVTNSVQHLASGEGAYSFFLNAQGRIQGDGMIFAEHDALWIETAATRVPGLMTMLDHFIIMDDVELADVSSLWSGLSIAGPHAASLLGKIGIEAAAPNTLTIRTGSWNQTQIRIVNAYGPLVPRFEIWIREVEQSAIAAISEALRTEGAVACDDESLEWLRILEGTPLYGADIRDRELPQETGQDRALHFAKGCYLGQEIVERIRSRGNVHRSFRGFRLDGDLPDAGATLEADGKPVGELTSIAAIPLPGAQIVQLALGYVRRDAVERGVPLIYQGGVATPISLPVSFPPSTAAASHQTPASELTERV